MQKKFNGARESGIKEKLDEKNFSLFILLLVFCTACAGTASPTATAQPTLTVTLSPAPTQTPTLTVTPTTTATPTATLIPTPDPIALAIAQFDLNPERTYTILNGYLVDSFNQAKMAKWENGAWVDTTLEEKYGHLIKEVYSQPVVKGYGNLFFDGGLTNDAMDSRYENVEICGNSTGNLWVEKEEISGLGIETDVIYGEFVFRDAKGEVKLLKVRVDVVDPEEREHIVDVSMLINPGMCFTSGSFFAKADNSEEKVSYFGPGTPVEITLAYKRPDQEPALAERIYRPEGGYSNLRNRANYYYWLEHKKELGDLAAQLLKAEDKDFSDIVIPAQFVTVIMTYEEALQLEQVEWAK